MVEATGLEPAASWSQTKRDTKLRHASIAKVIITKGLIPVNREKGKVFRKSYIAQRRGKRKVFHSQTSKK